MYVRIDNLGDSAVVIEARAWVLNADYWDVLDSVMEAFYKELPDHGAHFPLPAARRASVEGGLNGKDFVLMHIIHLKLQNYGI